MALSRINNIIGSSTSNTTIYSPSANTVAIKTSNTTRVTIANTGNTVFANSVTINGGVSAYLAQDNYPLFVSQSAGLPNGSTQANAAVQIGDVNSSRRLGFGTYSEGSWIQSSYPGQAGPAYPISLNPNGGGVAVNTSTAPREALDVNGSILQVAMHRTPVTGGATSTSSLTQAIHYIWAAASARGGWSKASTSNGAQYVMYTTGSNNDYMVWDIMFNYSYSLYYYVVFNNHADSATRAAAVDYSVDGGSTWINVGSISYGSSGGSVMSGTITFSDHLWGRHIKVRAYYTSGASVNPYLGISQVQFQTSGGTPAFIKCLG